MNQEPFTSFLEYLDERELNADEFVAVKPWESRMSKWETMGEQRKTFFSGTQKATPHQLISLSLEADDHYEAAKVLALEEGFPMDCGVSEGEPDLRCAAAKKVQRRKELHSAKEEWYEAVKELARRSELVAEHLKRFHTESAKRVAARVNVALMSMAVVLLKWPHTEPPLSFVIGVRVVGVMEPTGLYKPAAYWLPKVSEAEFVASATETVRHLESLVPKQEDVECTRAACEKSRLAGVAGGCYSNQECSVLD